MSSAPSRRPRSESTEVTAVTTSSIGPGCETHSPFLTCRERPGRTTKPPRAWPQVFAALQRVPGVELVDQVVLHPADPLTGKRGDPTDRIDLSPPSLVFSFDHRVRVIGDGS